MIELFEKYLSKRVDKFDFKAGVDSAKLDNKKVLGGELVAFEGDIAEIIVSLPEGKKIFEGKEITLNKEQEEDLI